MNRFKEFYNKRLLKYLGLFVSAFICFLHVRLLAPGVDAGLHLYGSMLVSKGMSPFHHLWNNKPPLIYFIGAAGFILQSNSFLGVRFVEVIFFILDLYLLYNIALMVRSKSPIVYLLGFSALFLVSWDQGFLTETFSIPLSLLALYLFLRRTTFFEWIAGLLLLLTFLLKQNGICIISGIILLDVFSQYRKGPIIKKIIQYIIAITFFSGLSWLILKLTSNWSEFWDQTFSYNNLHASKPSLMQFFTNQFFRNGFISVRGISLIMIFHLAILASLWQFLIRKRKAISLTIHDQAVLLSILIYFISYPIVYISGKTYPHYFMMLIIPATIVLSHYVNESSWGKITLGLLLVFGLITNIQLIHLDRQMVESRSEIANYVSARTNSEQPILVAGFGFQSIYVSANRLSTTRFVMPLFENDGYSEEYKRILLKDFSENPPVFIIVSKLSYRPLDPENFYTKVLMKILSTYIPVFENESFRIYKRGELLAVKKKVYSVFLASAGFRMSSVLLNI
jgi:hypothetical protein